MKAIVIYRKYQKKDQFLDIVTFTEGTSKEAASDWFEKQLEDWKRSGSTELSWHSDDYSHFELDVTIAEKLLTAGINFDNGFGDRHTAYTIIKALS